VRRSKNNNFGGSKERATAAGIEQTGNPGPSGHPVRKHLMFRSEQILWMEAAATIRLDSFWVYEGQATDREGRLRD